MLTFLVYVVKVPETLSTIRILTITPQRVKKIAIEESEMTEKLNVLFLAVDGVGHYNCCFGLASVLRDRGHKVTFAATHKWKGKLQAQGYGEELFTISDESQPTDEQAGENWGRMITKIIPALSQPSIVMHEAFYLEMWQEFLKEFQYANDQLKKIVQRVQPHVMILDFFQHLPALMETGKYFHSLHFLFPKIEMESSKIP